MKILSRYLIKEFLVHLAFCLLIYLFVLLVGKVFKELLTVFVTRRLGFEVLLGFMGYSMPFMLSFSLPLAALTAAVMTFGKFSADNELMATQASGINPMRLAMPVILIGGLLGFFASISNSIWAPQGIVAAGELVRDAILKKFETDPSILFEPGREVKEFPGYVVRVGSIDPQTRRLKDLRLTVLDKDGNIHSNYWAEAADITVKREEMKVTVRLFKLSGHILQPTLRPGLQADDYSIDFDLSKFLKQATRNAKWCDLTLPELLKRRDNMKGEHETISAITIEAHSRIVYAFACLAFITIGIPLGIKTHRRESSIGILVSILVAIGYYAFIVSAQSLKDKPEYYPVFILWAPNVIFAAIGWWLLRRASKN